MNVNQYLQKSGFVIPGNEIYGGKTGCYDYGHLGVLLKKNIQREWEKYFVMTRTNSYFLDAGILTSEDVWRASGHLENFNDVLVDCRECKKRFREDHLESSKCPNCGGESWTESKPFNLIFKTQESNYLRPETAQSIFINFKSILRITNARIPFSVCQVGKAFRNEVTLTHGIFRTKEFEQMECEWFVSPEASDECFNECIEDMQGFLTEILKIDPQFIKVVEIGESDRAHYSSRSTDIEFLFPHGWGELWGLANRADFDLKSHSECSKQDLSYLDPVTNQRYTPHVVEHSIGLNRLLYAVITASLRDDNGRELLSISHDLAPYRFSVLPLTKEEVELSRKIYLHLVNQGISTWFLQKGSIGKRYRKNDSIGTPYCLTIDQDSMSDPENPSFTVRDRDSMSQKRMTLRELMDNGYKVNF